jgi:aminoglycoside phosphotransferase (APT) family kinase protein
MTLTPAATVITSKYTSSSVSVAKADTPPSATKWFPLAEAAKWQNELAAYRILAEFAAPHVPALLDSGRSEAGYFLKLEYFESTPVVFANNAEGCRRAEQFGRVLQQIHSWDVRASHHAGALSPPPYSPSYCQYWTRLASEIAAAADWPRSLSVRLERWIAAFEPEVEATARPALVHRDLEPRNVLIAADDRLLIIDWEVSTIGHPDLDFGRLFWRGFHDCGELRRAFFAGYPASERQRAPETIAFFRAMFCLEMLAYLSSSNQAGDIRPQDLVAEIRESLRRSTR